MWAVCTIAAIAVCCLHVYSIVAEYLRHEVNVKVTKTVAPYLQFPALTLCNQNALRASLVAQHPQIQHAIHFGMSTLFTRLSVFLCYFIVNFLVA